MNHADFHIGLEFVGSAGFQWRCTDVGTRTILAIHLDRDNPDWYRGPPYIAKEVVFDEHEIESCHLTQDTALVATIHEHKSSGHPGYPAEVVRQMLEARHAHRYPNNGVSRFDRCRQPDGEILHPYAGRKDGEDWMVELYLPFQCTYDVMLERDFITLPLASPKDVRVRADRRRDA